jgi:hypothetical protein
MALVRHRDLWVSSTFLTNLSKWPTNKVGPLLAALSVVLGKVPFFWWRDMQRSLLLDVIQSQRAWI